MSTIITRIGKGSPLTNVEVDTNFTNLNTDKLEAATTATLTNKTINLTSNTLVATSAQIAAAVTDETGTGSLVFSASPALTGTPTAPTAAAATNTTQLATTAHVFAERTNTATLTNKTLTSPTINGGDIDATALEENNSPVVTQTDIGTAPNQIPLNQYLGNLAYQNADAIAGNLRAGGTITSDTNLAAPLANVNGVVFPATQNASSNANTLDDYEEGTFTPVLTGSTGGTFNFNVATYTKIGRMVYVRGEIQTSDLGALSGDVTITGLPFVATGLRAYLVNYSSDLRVDMSEGCYAVIGGGSSVITLKTESQSTTDNTNAWTDARYNKSGGTTVLSNFSGCYEVA
jgi:hypothetical protein